MATTMANSETAKDRLRKCRQNIDDLLASWDRISPEQRNRLIEETINEFEDLQEEASERRRMTSFETLLLGGTFACLGILKLLEWNGLELNGWDKYKSGL